MFFLLISEVWEINLLMFFVARALIFESRGPFGRFLEPLSDFFAKIEFTDPPQSIDFELFAIFFLIVFFECSRFGIFELLDARRLHFSSHFDSFLGALGVLKNRQKCVRVVNFRGLASPECDFFEDFDHECVLTLIFFQIFVIFSDFWDLNFDRFSIKNRNQKKVRKKGHRLVLRKLGKMARGGCGPLKEHKTLNSDS